AGTSPTSAQPVYGGRSPRGQTSVLCRLYGIPLQQIVAVAAKISCADLPVPRQNAGGGRWPALWIESGRPVVLVEDTTEDASPPYGRLHRHDDTRVMVGWTLIDALMWAMAVEVPLVGGQHGAGVPLIEPFSTWTARR
ncbi:hypothetical protein AAH979_42025, partial [Plantactinospora sp. ZYX-F-223]|uniref:hypothetical protein n=1 Tax=Plantactinospora sp. ZYX-F-223 TaxID=3144103 RepID=UPI0031FD67C5